MLKLSHQLSQINGLQGRWLTRLNKLNIKTVKDLLWHFPTRYEDFSNLVKIAELELNQTATIQGVVKDIGVKKTFRRRMIIVEALISDETGSIRAIWFNQPYIAHILRPGRLANFAGKVVLSEDEIYLSHPVYELLAGNDSKTKHTAGLIPVYPETRGLTSKGLRFLINLVLRNLTPLPEFLPPFILKTEGLPEINRALPAIHFPKTLAEAEQAKRRFAFEDLFLLQLNNLKIRLRLAQEKAPSLKINRRALLDFISSLPFTLTASQKQAAREILGDSVRSRPMNRLLQGDVGSGKTVVAALAAFVVAQNNKQTAFMAPTEVLARQHYRTLMKILPLPIGLLVAKEARFFFGNALENKCSKKTFLEQTAAGRLRVIIGTHALIQKGVSFQDLALIIVDEQHRFGVEQRAMLTKNQESRMKNHEKANPLILNSKPVIPHFLSMSATPIPRTLSLTVFGDLDLSVITELPQGRKNIVTKIVAPANREKAYQFIRGQIRQDRQAFVICPRIESVTAADGIQTAARGDWDEVKAVKEEYEKLSKQIFPDLKVAMLHGRLKSAEKAQIMNDFAQNEINILVSTSVIEVGVDIPNATIMMIEGAERFGLAQLYQFRGRVGRGKHQSFCLLFTDSTSATVFRRLNSLLQAKNGFELAEKDLSIRGPGEFLGRSQTGMPDLAMRALNNPELIKTSRQAALAVMNDDPDLKQHPLLRLALSKFQKEIHLE